MKKRTRSILQELSNIGTNSHSDLLIETTASNIIESSINLLNTINKNYENDVTDEFIKPLIVTENEKPVAKIEENDVVIFFNFRTDRGRELTNMLSQNDFPEQETKKLDLYFVTMTNYDDSFENIKIIYNKNNT